MLGKYIIWLFGLFILLNFCGFIINSSVGNQWGTPEYGSICFVVNFLWFLTFGAVKKHLQYQSKINLDCDESCNKKK